jgi:hypothetical protein
MAWDLESGVAIATDHEETSIQSWAFTSSGGVVAGDAEGHVLFLSLVLPAKP